MTAYEKLTKCYECVKSKIDFEPKVALVAWLRSWRLCKFHRREIYPQL